MRRSAGSNLRRPAPLVVSGPFAAMGGAACCGNSSKAPLSEQGVKEMCNTAAYDICEHIVSFSMNGLRDENDDTRIKLEVRTPAIVDDWRQTAAEFREQAQDLADDATSGTTMASDAGEKVASGGFLGNALGKVAGVVDSGLGKMKELGSMGLKKALETAADGIDKSVDQFQKPFNTVGNDVVKAQGGAIEDIFKHFYTNYQFANAPKLIRGENPQTGDGYEALKNTAAISGGLTKTAHPAIVGKLRESGAVQKGIQEHNSFKAWKAAIDANQTMCDGLTSVFEKSSQVVESKKMETLRQKVEGMKTDLVLEDHIMNEIVAGILDQLENREIAVRNKPSQVQAVKSKCTQSFWKVFSKDPLIVSDHNQWVREQKQ
jgi:hypothetical protein